MIDSAIKQLVEYGVSKGLVNPEDITYTTNRILEVLHLDSFDAIGCSFESASCSDSGNAPDAASTCVSTQTNNAAAAGLTGCAFGSVSSTIYSSESGNQPAIQSRVGAVSADTMTTPSHNSISSTPALPAILDELTDYAAEHGLIPPDSITCRDLFDTKLMGCLTPPPSLVHSKFHALYSDHPKKATDWYYDFSCTTNYIRLDRIARDMQWKVDTAYGPIDITINLSKPEKDPKAIAAARSMPASAYPNCLLCRENEGYAGRVDHPARQNHRIVPVTINGKPWYLQYSPYVYYNEHCIVFNREHTPMKIDRDCFGKLLDFVRQFPHYFVGSNADLPLVGGSILAHDHFQGGRYSFAMEKAGIDAPVTFSGYEDIRAGIVKWPLSVLRLASDNIGRLADLADKILNAWRGYTDESAIIYAETHGEPHNTITPIARMRDGLYELDLALRNNLTTPEHPLGLYHPHAEIHHIKKENIGLIEVMGLAVLPARLKEELAVLAETLLAGEDLSADERTAHHAEWAHAVAAARSLTPENITAVLQKEVGKVFTTALEQSGVFMRSEIGRAAFLRFVNHVNAM